MDLLEFISYFLITPFDLIFQLLKWVFVVAILGISLYALWFFISTPIKYLWIGIKKLFTKK